MNILNTLILERILGITEEQLSLSTSIATPRTWTRRWKRCASGEMQVALILNPTALQDVITIAENDEKMPRKSTHFYPKPVSGLVFYPMDRSSTRPKLSGSLFLARRPAGVYSTHNEQRTCRPAP